MPNEVAEEVTPYPVDLLARFDHRKPSCSGAELRAGIDDLFTYHSWEGDADKIQAAKNVRESLADAYECIICHVPPSPSRTRALNAIEDARMLANKALTFNGKV
jgi:hypothetical protein